MLADHVWQSTLFVLAVALLTLLLRNNAARFRYWVWLAASLKFLIPFSWLNLLGAQLVSHFAISGRQVPESFARVVQQVADPLGTPPVVMRAPLSAGLPIGRLLAAIWVAGCLALLARWLARWLQINAAARCATPAPVEAPIAVRSTPLLWEPGVVGILRPVLLLPTGISARLTPSQLQAVIAHELCHIRRRDNLTAAIHMVVEVLFWFHPLVWWIGARLVEERERACDEAVLELGNEPQTYAEGILKVCQFYMESKLTCVCGVSGSRLTRRIEDIMKNRISRRLTSPKKILLASATAAVFVLPVAVGLATSPHVAGQTANAAAAIIVFEKVDITRATGEGGLLLGIYNEEFLARNLSLRAVIAFVYDVEQASVLGGPGWLDKPVYNIDAHAGAGAKLGVDDMRPLVKAMLVDRFGLQAHTDVRPVAAFVLRVDQGGSKLSTAAASSRGHPAGLLMPGGGGQLIGTDTDLKPLTHWLSDVMGQPVLNQTGLTGRYDFSLKGTHTPEALPAELQEQLGLRLEAVTSPVDLIVVDDMQEPTLDVQSAAASSADVPTGALAARAAARRSL